MKTVEKGTDFESDVCSILYQTNPYSISHYDGGADRGRDIVVQYKVEEKIYDVIVECKCYSYSVDKEHIMSSLNWAKVHKPAILYLWIKPYLTPATKDYIKLFSKEYDISILYEEELNIEKYQEELGNKNSEILLKLRERILDVLKKAKHIKLVELEYDSQIANTDHYLADREIERDILMKNEYDAYYIQGVSSCGKTQLLKNIAFMYQKNGRKIFWHTIREEEGERQTKAFYLTLSHFFEIHYNDNSLQKYLEDHGNFLSNELIALLTTLLKNFHPIMVIDDAHKCSADNYILRDTFETIISDKLCRIYYIGWFNIFHRTPNIISKLKILILKGLQDNYIDEIIVHHIGTSKKNIAILIQNKFNGLPGYAVLVDSNTNKENLESSSIFIHSFIERLNLQEKKVLLILTYISIPVEKKYLFKFDLLESVISLVDKRLIENSGKYYTVHDAYRPFFREYNINETEFQDIIRVIKNISETEIIISLDIINLYIEHDMFDEAFDFLQKSFPKLLHLQFIKETLKVVQNMEEGLDDNKYLIELCKMKIVLLERLSQYGLCIQYLAMFEGDVDFCSIEWEDMYYIKLRCYYFRNQYDEIVNSFFQNRNFILEKMKKNLKIQILLLIGRIFYIRGNLESSLKLYLLGYQYAIAEDEIILAVKVIHRIAMIECCKGLYQESKDTFLTLTKMNSYITPKRKSYAYYRIAKCYFMMDQTDKSIYYTKESLSIKKSYNDQRGIIFSYKMLAKNYFKKENYVKAISYIIKAKDLAEKLQLSKEVLSLNLILIENVLNYELEYDEEIILNLLEKSLDIAVHEKLLFRIYTIMRLTKHKWTELYRKANEQYQIAKVSLDKQCVDQRTLYDQCFCDKMYSLFERLNNKDEAITPLLLRDIGLETFNFKTIKIDIDKL